MTLIEWLDAERGRADALATDRGVSKAAVSQWKTNGVPVGQMKAVHQFTGGAVTLEEMVLESTDRRAERKSERDTGHGALEDEAAA